MNLPPLDTLLPHAGRMRLIDRIERYDAERIVCATASHRATRHPLSHAGVLPIVCGLEYGAQAMAMHGTLLARAAAPAAGPPPRHGLLIAASDVSWTVERLDECAAPLLIEAISEVRDDRHVSYRFELRAAGFVVLSGRALVLLEH